MKALPIRRAYQTHKCSSEGRRWSIEKETWIGNDHEEDSVGSCIGLVYYTVFIPFLKKGLKVTFGHIVCWKRVIGGYCCSIPSISPGPTWRMLTLGSSFKWDKELLETLCTHHEVSKTLIYQLTLRSSVEDRIADISESNLKHDHILWQTFCSAFLNESDSECHRLSNMIHLISFM